MVPSKRCRRRQAPDGAAAAASSETICGCQTGAPRLRKWDAPAVLFTIAFADDTPIVQLRHSHTCKLVSYVVARHPHLAPTSTAYHGSSPHKYRYSSADSGRIAAASTPPLSARLSSRLGSAVATGRINKTTTTTTRTTIEKAPTLPNIKHLTQRLVHTNSIANAEHSTMDEHDYEGGGEQGELGFPAFPRMITDGMYTSSFYE